MSDEAEFFKDRCERLDREIGQYVAEIARLREAIKLECKEHRLVLPAQDNFELVECDCQLCQIAREGK